MKVWISPLHAVFHWNVKGKTRKKRKNTASFIWRLGRWRTAAIDRTTFHACQPVLPSARICPYFYGNSTCNPQYGNAVVDSANLKKSKPISNSLNLKQVSVSNWLRTMPGDRSVSQLAADQHLAARYYLKLDTTLVAWHALSEVRVQFGGLYLVFNDPVWATKFPTAQEEGEKSWSFLVIVAFTARNFVVRKKACILPSALVAPWTSPLTMAASTT